MILLTDFLFPRSHSSFVSPIKSIPLVEHTSVPRQFCAASVSDSSHTYFPQLRDYIVTPTGDSLTGPAHFVSISVAALTGLISGEHPIDSMGATSAKMISSSEAPLGNTVVLRNAFSELHRNGYMSGALSAAAYKTSARGVSWTMPYFGLKFTGYKTIDTFLAAYAGAGVHLVAGGNGLNVRKIWFQVHGATGSKFPYSFFQTFKVGFPSAWLRNGSMLGIAASLSPLFSEQYMHVTGQDSKLPTIAANFVGGVGAGTVGAGVSSLFHVPNQLSVLQDLPASAILKHMGGGLHPVTVGLRCLAFAWSSGVTFTLFSVLQSSLLNNYREAVQQP